MFGQTPPEVGCIDGSIESLCSGAVAGAVYGWVFRDAVHYKAANAKNTFAALKNCSRVAFIAGSWCFYGSCASCALIRAGLGDLLAAAGAGFVAGSAVGMQLRLDPKTLVLVTGGSVLVSLAASAAGQAPTQAQEILRKVHTATSRDNKKNRKMLCHRSDRSLSQPLPAVFDLVLPSNHVSNTDVNKLRQHFFSSFNDRMRLPTQVCRYLPS
jgi:uncharacterized membrane protein (Fun14 family)